MREAAGFKNQKRKAALEARAVRRGNKKLEGVPDTTTFMRRHGEDFDGVAWLERWRGIRRDVRPATGS